MADLVIIEPQDKAEDVVPLLERALEKARSGRVSAVGIAFVYSNGDMGASWSTLPSTPLMLGAISRLEYKVNLELDETTVPDSVA